MTIKAIMMAGKEISTSTIRLSAESIHPRWIAARKPRAEPIRKASAEMARARLKVTRAPYSNRDSKSRPDNGIVVFRHRAFNQHDELVGECKRSALMLRKP